LDRILERDKAENLVSLLVLFGSIGLGTSGFAISEITGLGSGEFETCFSFASLVIVGVSFTISAME
jgi:low temperature requirement protein LtrA